MLLQQKHCDGFDNDDIDNKSDENNDNSTIIIATENNGKSYFIYRKQKEINTRDIFLSLHPGKRDAQEK